ncbi:MAG TPA: glycosyltransferase family 4 protein, partial [Methanoregula sp.]|nr:glycosyltransferase family 4 protein [Methanoregula sp.]
LIYGVSHNICDHIVADFSIAPKKVHYLPFGIDTDLFRPGEEIASSADGLIQVFSNRGFFPVYDNETLIRGFAQAYARNPLLRLTLKGDGPLEQPLHDLVASLGMSEVVTFKSKTPYADVPSDYHMTDIFITTSVSDGTPVSILEAMASALPCIATSVGGIPEWIDDNKTGLLIPPRSPDRVAEALLTLAADSNLRSRLGAAAREFVVKNGRWESLMAEAEKDYQALIATYNP